MDHWLSISEWSEIGLVAVRQGHERSVGVLLSRRRWPQMLPNIAREKPASDGENDDIASSRQQGLREDIHQVRVKDDVNVDRRWLAHQSLVGGEKVRCGLDAKEQKAFLVRTPRSPSRSWSCMGASILWPLDE